MRDRQEFWVGGRLLSSLCCLLLCQHQDYTTAKSTLIIKKILDTHQTSGSRSARQLGGDSSHCQPQPPSSRCADQTKEWKGGHRRLTRLHKHAFESTSTWILCSCEPQLCGQKHWKQSSQNMFGPFQNKTHHQYKSLPRYISCLALDKRCLLQGNDLGLSRS